MAALIGSQGQAAAAKPVLVAGVDEVGRGCLAGPVYAAAVVLNPGQPLPGLRDSKKLSAKRREMIDAQIRQCAVAWAIGRADVDEIDTLNILQASFLAMRRAVAGLGVVPELCRVDGNQDPKLPMKTQLIVGGDATEPAIMAASIVAKVARDAEMQVLDREFPGYALARNKGYGTAEHLSGLRGLGPVACHRMSFAPCRDAKLQGTAGKATPAPFRA